MEQISSDLERVIDAFCKKTGEKVISLVITSIGDEKNIDQKIHKNFDNLKGSNYSISYCSVIIWTKKFILFTDEYDGTYSIKVLPRNPALFITSHIGGISIATDHIMRSAPAEINFKEFDKAMAESKR
ncbi:MAG: hypothetical protein US50_C0048G0003 [Candidatus Nomurabacteria bacterium GW2011_GWB1_37_5]|uniref:Uncharacterized protein n=1 Tax=Candidatus Nomurabacteria bacterium GW2011_GWB1_37_5 TaxID=1618742 RepID=A0A0G0K1D3_9BACT|nr:MAG: hypothetical protein US50_C0048G0003 [Candidatus Nomurabacteria bacterium GW2011_GWB1_37_5]